MRKINRIGIITLERNHYQFYNSIIQLFYDNIDSITFITLEDIKNQIIDKAGYNSKVKFITTKDIYKYRSLILSNLTNIKGNDLLIFDQIFTCHPILLLLTLVLNKIPKYIVLHDINLWLNPPIKLKFKYLFYFLLRSLILHFMKGIIVVSPNIKKYIESSSLTKKEVYSLPFSIPNKNKKKNNQDHKDILSIAIPGVVDGDKRNYFDILEVISKIFKEENIKIELKLLGKPKGKVGSEIINKSQEINRCANFNLVKYWEDFIPDNIFEEEIMNSDMLLTNLNIVYKNKNIHEIYGITKETGIVYIMIEYMKPMLTQKDLQILNGFENQIMRYNDIEDLKKILIRIAKDKNMLRYLNNYALQNSIDYYDKVKRESYHLLIYS